MQFAADEWNEAASSHAGAYSWCHAFRRITPGVHAGRDIPGRRAPARPERQAPDNDLHRRSHRHRPVRGLRQDNPRQRARRRPRRLRAHRGHGLPAHAVAGRDGGLHTRRGLLRRVRRALHQPQLRLRHGVELLVQLGDHGRRRARRGVPRHEVLVPRRPRVGVVGRLPLDPRRAQRPVRARLRGGGVLVRPRQGRRGRRLPRPGRPHHRRHPRRHPPRIRQLDEGRGPLRQRIRGCPGDLHGGGLQLPGHGDGRRGRRGGGQSREAGPQGHPHDLLADPALLHRRDLRDRHPHLLQEQQSARRGCHRRGDLPLHPRFQTGGGSRPPPRS